MKINEYFYKIYFDILKPQEFAGFFVRFLAFLIDFTILGIINYFLIVSYYLKIKVRSEKFDPLWLISHPYSLIVNWFYYSFFESNPNYQATIGKSIFRLQVVDIYGKNISFGKASIRFFSKFISGIILGIGFFMIAFNKKSQGLHDLAAGSFVKFK